MLWTRQPKTRKEPPTQRQQQQGNTNTKVTEKRKPVFVKVDQLKLGTNGHNLIVKVLKSDAVVPKGRSAASPSLRQTRIAECLVGDDTATILFTARNNQVDLMKPETTIILRNAKIDKFKGIDEASGGQTTEPTKFVAKKDNNLSLVEYELVNVAEE